MKKEEVINVTIAHLIYKVVRKQYLSGVKHKCSRYPLVLKPPVDWKSCLPIPWLSTREISKFLTVWNAKLLKKICTLLLHLCNWEVLFCLCSEMSADFHESWSYCNFCLVFTPKCMFILSCYLCSSKFMWCYPTQLHMFHCLFCILEPCWSS